MFKLYKDSNVLTKLGRKIVNEVTVGDEIFDGKSYSVVKNISTPFLEECYNVTNDYGYTLTTSLDQKLKSVNSLGNYDVVVRNIEIGNCVGMTIGVPYEKELIDLDYFQYEKKTYSNKSNRLNENVMFPNKLNSDLAYLLGYAYGDGYVERDKFNETCTLSLACSDDYPEIKDKLKRITKHLFNYDICISKGDGRLEKYTINNKIILHNLEKNEILKQKAGQLIFPEKILTSPSEIQFAFISGVFDADGCAQKSKKSFSIEIIDEMFLKEIQMILNANGCVSRFSYKDRYCERWNIVNRLYLVGSASIYKFAKLMKESVKIQQTEIRNTRDTVLTIYNTSSLNVKYSNFKFINNKDFISYNNFNKLCSHYDLSNFEIVLQSEVKKKEFIGEVECYSLDVDCKGIWVDGYYALA